jgi:hypothetical protein
MYGVRMERGVIVRFSLANNNTVFAVGKNDAVRDGFERAIHDLAPAPGRGLERKNETFNSTVACAAAGVKFGKFRICRACGGWPGCENDPGSSMTPYRPEGSHRIRKNSRKS